MRNYSKSSKPAARSDRPSNTASIQWRSVAFRRTAAPVGLHTAPTPGSPAIRASQSTSLGMVPTSSPEPRDWASQADIAAEKTDTDAGRPCLRMPACDLRKEGSEPARCKQERGTRCLHFLASAEILAATRFRHSTSPLTSNASKQKRLWGTDMQAVRRAHSPGACRNRSASFDTGGAASSGASRKNDGSSPPPD